MPHHRAFLACLIWAGIAGHLSAANAAAQDTATVRLLVGEATAPDTMSVSVTLRSEQEAGGLWVSSVSPATRLASVTHLPPGTFRVTVDIDGATSVSGILTAGTREVVTLRLVRDPGAGTGYRLDVIDRQRAGEGADFDERWLHDLPAGNVWSIVETTVPFVIADRMDNGGLGLGRSALLGSRGASWTTTSVTFGDISVLAPNLVGLVPFAPDLEAVSAVSVLSGLARVEADTPGVIVALSPRRPGAARRGALQASFSEPAMVDVNPRPGAPSIARLSSWREVGGQFSGPVGERTGLLLSASGARSRQHERDLPGLWTSSTASLFGHLVSNTTDRDQVRVIAAAQRVRYPFEHRRQFRDRAVDERGGFLQAGATWERLSGGAQTSASLNFQRGAFTPQGTGREGGTVERVTEGVVPRPASALVSTQWEARGSMASRPLAWGRTSHEFRAGLSGRRSTATTDILAFPTVAEQVGGIAARVWVPAAPASASQRTLHQGSAYLADRITAGASLSVDAGIRADIVSGSAEGASSGITWRTVSPRFSFQWSRGPVALFGGAGLYTDPLTLALLGYGDPGETVSDVYRWHDLNNDRRFDAGERGVLVSRAGWGQPVASIDPQLRAPRTFERTAGLELRYRQLLTFRSAAIWRDQTSLPASVNTGVPLSSYRVFSIIDQYGDWDGASDDRPLTIYDRLPESFGKDVFLLTNPEGGKATYEGLEFTWLLTTRRLLVLFGATAYRTRSWVGHLGFGPLENDQSVIGERLEQPNAQPVLQGSYFFDRSYVGKWSASYRAPGDIRVGIAARYQDGQPFSRVVIAPDLAGGAQMIHAYRTGRTRYTYTLTLDVRVEKGFSLGGRRAAVRVDVFNATRWRNEVEEDALTTPAFRRSTAVQPPLTARLGFRLTF